MAQNERERVIIKSDTSGGWSHLLDFELRAEEVSILNFYTVVIRQSGIYWVALCLENGLVGQADTKDDAVRKLKEAIESFDEACRTEEDVYNKPLSIKDLHEFLVVEGKEPAEESYELKAVYA